VATLQSDTATKLSRAGDTSLGRQIGAGGLTANSGYLPGPNAFLGEGGRVLYIASNALPDGTHWNRANAAYPAWLLYWDAENSQTKTYYVGAGTNPIGVLAGNAGWTLIGQTTGTTGQQDAIGALAEFRVLTAPGDTQPTAALRAGGIVAGAGGTTPPDSAFKRVAANLWSTLVGSVYGIIRAPIHAIVPNAVSGATTMTSRENFYRCTSAGAGYTMTLPDVSTCPGHWILVLKASNNADVITVAGSGGQLIEGAASVTLTLNLEKVWVLATGSSWIILKKGV
jgi:hypothetical protein